MNIQDLDEFLHIDTSGEKWHLKHPGELSPFYLTYHFTIIKICNVIILILPKTFKNGSNWCC